MSTDAGSYLLDTMTVAALMKGDPAALDRLEAEERSRVFLAQPVLAEIEYGLARLPKSKRRRRLEERFHRVAQEIPRLPWTDEVSHAFGAAKAALEKKGQRLEDLDLAIAAHALAHRATLATSNLRHMRRVPGLTTQDWLSAP